MTMSQTLALMEQAARKAGESLRHDFLNRHTLVIDTKGPGDLVSQADRRSEEIIVSMLTAARPDWGILGEEGTDRTGSEAGTRWITDPLDGTSNFLHGIPLWAVTIALEQDNEIVAGVTYDPLHDELFVAEKGSGAFVNGRKMAVSPLDRAAEATVLIDSAPYDHARIGRYCEAFSTIEHGEATSVRVIGCAALDLAYVAAGRVDACFLQGKLKPWDVATGMLLIREAGGLVTDLALQPAHHTLGEMLAANPVLHPQLAQLLGL